MLGDVPYCRKNRLKRPLTEKLFPPLAFSLTMEWLETSKIEPCLERESSCFLRNFSVRSQKQHVSLFSTVRVGPCSACCQGSRQVIESEGARNSENHKGGGVSQTHMPELDAHLNCSTVAINSHTPYKHMCSMSILATWKQKRFRQSSECHYMLFSNVPRGETPIAPVLPWGHVKSS